MDKFSIKGFKADAAAALAEHTAFINSTTKLFERHRTLSTYFRAIVANMAKICADYKNEVILSHGNQYTDEQIDIHIKAAQELAFRISEISDDLREEVIISHKDVVSDFTTKAGIELMILSYESLVDEISSVVEKGVGICNDYRTSAEKAVKQASKDKRVDENAIGCALAAAAISMSIYNSMARFYKFREVAA